MPDRHAKLDLFRNADLIAGRLLHHRLHPVFGRIGAKKRRDDLGYFDDEECRLEPIEKPFARKCYLCAPNELSRL